MGECQCLALGAVCGAHGRLWGPAMAGESGYKRRNAKKRRSASLSRHLYMAVPCGWRYVWARNGFAGAMAAPLAGVRLLGAWEFAPIEYALLTGIAAAALQ